MRVNRFAAFLLIMITGCGKSKPLDANAYLKWFKSADELVKTKEINGIVFKLKKKPIDFFVARDFLTGHLKADQANRERKEYEGLNYYELTIKLTDPTSNILKHGVSDADQYMKRINYCSYEMKGDFTSEGPDGSKDCKLYHFEQSYNMASHAIVDLAFDKPVQESNKDEVIVYDDKVFGVGKIKFRFGVNDLKKLPQLSI